MNGSDRGERERRFRRHRNAGWRLLRAGDEEGAVREFKESLACADGIKKYLAGDPALFKDVLEVNYELAHYYYRHRLIAEAAGALARCRDAYVPKGDVFLKNRLLNRIEFLKRKRILRSKPLFLTVSLTARCNLRCIMCIEGKKGTSLDLPVGIARDVMRMLPYLQFVEWLGGEVFMVKHFEQLFDKACGNPHLLQRITTNGTLLTERWIEKLSRHRVDLALSIDAFNRETYEYIRRGAKFDVLMRNLKLLKKYFGRKGCPAALSLNFVVMRSNYGEIEKAVDFAHAYGITTIRFYSLISSPLFKENINNDAAVLGRINAMMPAVLRKAGKLGIRCELGSIFSVENIQRAKALANIPALESTGDAAAESYVACRTPWERMTMVFYGTVFPDCHCKLPVGNTRCSPLGSIWNSKCMQMYRMGMSFGECGKFCDSLCLSEKQKTKDLIKLEL